MIRPQAREELLGTSAKEVARTVAKRAIARKNDPRVVWGLPHFSDGLNIILGGIHKTEMTVLTARPSVGKTQFFVHETEGVTSHLETPTGKQEYPDGDAKVILCESTKEIFVQRWACIRAQVPSKRVLSGTIRNYPEQWDRFMEELEYISNLPVRYLDEPKSIHDIIRFLDDGKTVWWGLDHIQVCPYLPGKANDNSIGVLTAITTELANAAKSIAPGLVLAHTPREVDKREDRRPRLGDIKGSSSIEGAARVVLGMYTDRIYLKLDPSEMNTPYVIEVQVLKNNNGGGVGQVVDLKFDPRTGLFTDISEIISEED